MKAAQPLDGENLPPPDLRDRAFDAPRDRSSRRGLDEYHPRAADRTGDRLGMVTAVERVCVFPGAILTHLESRHGRPSPVVWQGVDDCVTRAAVGAIGERIAKPPLAGRPDLLKAVWAGRDVGRNEDEALALLGRENLEISVSHEGRRFEFDLFDEGERRLLSLESPEEGITLAPARAFEMDFDAEADVLDPAREAEPLGQSKDERPEPDSLDDSEDDQPDRERLLLFHPAERFL